MVHNVGRSLGFYYHRMSRLCAPHIGGFFDEKLLIMGINFLLNPVSVGLKYKKYFFIKVDLNS